MRQYFAEQIQRNRDDGVQGLAEDQIPALVERYVDGGWDREQAEAYFRKHIGDSPVFFMIQNVSGTNIEILKIFESEIEEFFDETIGYDRHYASLPRFISKARSIEKVFSLNIL